MQDSNSRFRLRFLLPLLACFMLTANAQAQWEQFLRSIETELGDLAVVLPDAGHLMDGAALTTSIEDAVYGFGPLDPYTPLHPSSFRILEKDADGAFLIPPGAYLGQFESYCLKAGTHGPGGGDGYLDAPLRGPKADIIQTILRNSARHPDISQDQIQILLWAVIARSGIRGMSPDLAWTAGRLLSPSQILRLNGDAVGVLPGSVLGSLLGGLSADVRRPLDAENQIRRLLQNSNFAYQNLADVAILRGIAPLGSDSVRSPAGRWSYHSDGYFVRFEPDSVHRTRIEVLVPPQIRIHRDGLERIIAIEDSSGNRVEVEYDDSQEPLRLAEARLVGYPFRLVRFARASGAANEPELVEWRGSGWTWLGRVPVTGRESLFEGNQDPVCFDRRSRLLSAVEQTRLIDRFYEGASMRTRSVDLDPYRLSDLVQFAEGVRAATRGAASGNPVWIPDHLELLHQAIASEVRTQMGTSPDWSGTGRDRVRFDPAEHIAVPGNTARQRLGLSARMH